MKKYLVEFTGAFFLVFTIGIPVLLLLTSCSTTPAAPNTKSADSSPETVIVRYQVKSGKAAELEVLLAQAWQIYRREHMVLSHPHIVAAERDADYKVEITEIFTWVNHRTPEHAPADVQQIWAAMQTLCEPRNGQPGLGGGEVQIISE